MMKVLVALAIILYVLASVLGAPSAVASGFGAVVDEGTKAMEAGEYERAFEIAFPYAEAGDADAQFMVALLLGWGYGHGKSDPTMQERESKSLVWLRRAALQGHRMATQTLSDAFRNGWYGLRADTEISRCWQGAAGDASAAARCSQLEVMPPGK